MTGQNNPVSEELVEAIGLAILNSDRIMAGLPAVESRATIPDSDGYLVNARAILTSPALQAELQAAHRRGMAEAAEIVEDFDGQNSDPWGWPQLIAQAIRSRMEKKS